MKKNSFPLFIRLLRHSICLSISYSCTCFVVVLELMEIIDIRSHAALPAMCTHSSACTLSYEIIALEVLKLG